MSAMLFAPDGTAAHASCGDTSLSSQVYFLGIISPSMNAVLVTLTLPMAVPPGSFEFPSLLQ